MHKTKILIVDDEADVRTNLVDQFMMDDDFDVTEASTAKQALETVLTSEIDLVVMDVGLPDADGRETVKSMRAAGFLAPVIMLSGLASDEDAIKGLEAGAYDYVAKPYRFALLLAKVRTQLRLWQQSGDSVARIAGYGFRFATRELVDDSGVATKLTEKEAGILRFLLQAQRAPVTRETLLREVWRYNAAVDTHTLETHVYRLRRKIEADHSRPQFIRTAPGGYRLLPDGMESGPSARAA